MWCHKFTCAEPPDPKKTSVFVSPEKSVVHEWQSGPATVLETRTVIYPCVRYKRSVPCRCWICLKSYPKCRVSMSQGCSCDDCSLHFAEHTQFQRTFKFGSKWCFQLEKIFPHFNFFSLEAWKNPLESGIRGPCPKPNVVHVEPEKTMEEIFKIEPGKKIRGLWWLVQNAMFMVVMHSVPEIGHKWRSTLS